MELFPLIVAILSLKSLQVVTQETRCICWLRRANTLYTYDMEKMNIALPCIYRMTSLMTSDSRCHLTVDLAMTLPSQDGSSTTRPAGLRYLVTSDGATTGGIIDGRGVRSIDPDLRNANPIAMSSLTSVDGVDVLAYRDDQQSYKLSLVECRITLEFKPGQYLGIYSHNFSSDYNYNMADLCGDCDGTKNEMTKLPTVMTGSVSSLRQRDAAMLYMTSQHITGGSSRCFDYKSLIEKCPQHLALQALDTCGRLLDPTDQLATCLRRRTFMGRILDTYFDCVTAFCSQNSTQGCRFVRSLARSTFCSIPSHVDLFCF